MIDTSLATNAPKEFLLLLAFLLRATGKYTSIPSHSNKS
jgi:hypothetical protein